MSIGRLELATREVRLRALRAPRLPRLGWLGLAVVVGFVLLAVSSPLAPYGPHAAAGAPLEAPSSDHLLGTNGVGQDVFSQVLSGARVSLLVAFLAGGGSLLLGAVAGLLAGWLGGWVEAAVMRIVDVFLVIPRLPLLIVLAAYVGSSVRNITLIIALTSWPPGARVVRSQVLSLRSRMHLRAAVGFGAGTVYVLRRHVVPEISLILAAGFVAAAERAVVLEAGLAFLGLGDPSQESWGGIMRDALAFSSLFLTSAWSWWLLPPVVAVTMLLLGITFLGVAIEERVNPRLRRHVVGAAA